MSWATSLRRRKERIDGVFPADANPYILRPNIRRAFRLLISVSSAPRVPSLWLPSGNLTGDKDMVPSAVELPKRAGSRDSRRPFAFLKTLRVFAHKGYTHQASA